MLRNRGRRLDYKIMR
ncbi:hypothetical protein E8Y37_RS08770 [Escherichia coli]|nr:hypothetical protein [Escherichia coli]